MLLLQESEAILQRIQQEQKSEAKEQEDKELAKTLQV